MYRKCLGNVWSNLTCVKTRTVNHLTDYLSFGGYVSTCILLTKGLLCFINAVDSSRMLRGSLGLLDAFGIKGVGVVINVKSTPFINNTNRQVTYDVINRCRNYR